MNSNNYNSLIKLASPQINPATYKQPSSLPARDAEFYKTFTSLPEGQQFTKLNPKSRDMINAVGQGTAARDADFYKSLISHPEGHQYTKLNPRSRAMINAVGRGTPAGAVGGGTAGVTMSEPAKLNPSARVNTIRTGSVAGNTAPSDSYIPGTYPAVNPDTGGNRANGVYRYY